MHPIKFNKHSEQFRTWKPKSSTITFKNGKLNVNVIVEKDSDVEKSSNGAVIGLDRGINNIAVGSNNQFFNSKRLRNTKAKYQYNRSVLQAKGTRKARLKLKKTKGRETRFVADVNHCISKALVNSGYGVFVIERLKGIKRKRRGRKFNKKLGNWSYAQLEQFLEYKAEGVGKIVIQIDPRHTSQKCSSCGHIEKANRNGAVFKCKKCGFELNADLNAARNIAELGISQISRVSSTTQTVPNHGVDQADHFNGR